MAPWVQALVGVALCCGPPAVLSLWSRVRFARQPESFRCRLGAASRRRPWRRCSTRARWVNDVLLIQTGLLRTGTTAVVPRVPSGSRLRWVPREDVRGLGGDPVALRLTVDDGRPLDIAVDGRNRMLLVGPFLAAALSGLPRAPREQGT